MNPIHRAAARVVGLGVELDATIAILLVNDRLGTDSGVPLSVLEQYKEEGAFHVLLDTEYRAQQEIGIDEDHLHINLSFDDLYRCKIPWHAVLTVSINTDEGDESPRAVCEEEPQASAGSHLTLVSE